jgi:DNA-binding transcriptional MocR family regulator
MAMRKDRLWAPVVGRSKGPIYLALVDAMATDIASGRLRPGQAMPTQRVLAKQLGVDLTTITRAYGEARRRGLIDATVGRGTIVRASAPAAVQPAKAPLMGAARPLVDTTMNLPPQPRDARLVERYAEGIAAALRQPDALALLTYRDSASSEADRSAGAAWLKPRLGAVPLNRVLLCAGAQAALTVIISTLTKPDDVVVSEALTYPGFRALAAQLGVTVKGLAMDGEGILPSAFEEACRHDKPKALYCIPTIQNPTTATMSLARRRQIAAIARRFDVPIIEDDAYGHLPGFAPPPLASLAPELTYHIATMSKCLMPGLRIAYLVAPDTAIAARLAAGIRATTLMVPPLSAALATRWIGDGTAQKILDAIRRESAARQTIAHKLLSPNTMAAHPDGLHLWLTLPAGWSVVEFMTYFQPRGLAAVPGHTFSVDGAATNAVRLSLGAAADRTDLTAMLEQAATALAQSASIWSAVT